MPLDYETFKKLVRSEGCTIVAETKHRSIIVDLHGMFLCDFSIRHRKGAKDMVLDCYVRKFKKALQK